MVGWRRKFSIPKTKVVKLLRGKNDELAMNLANEALDPDQSVKDLQALIRKTIKVHGSRAVVNSSSVVLKTFQENHCPLKLSRNFYTATTRALSFYDNQNAINFGELYLDEFNDIRVIHSLVKFYLRTKETKRPLELLEHLEIDDWHKETKSILKERESLKGLESKYRKEFTSLLSSKDNEIREFVSTLIDKTNDKINVYRLAYQLLFKDFRNNKRHSQLIIEYGEKILTKFSNSFQIRLQVCNVHQYRGNLKLSLKILEEHPEITTKQLGKGSQNLESLKTKKESINELLRLHSKGFTYNLKNPVDHYEQIPRKIFYLLHNSLPYDSGGYAVRSHGLLSQIKRSGWDIQGVTRLGYPKDRENHKDVKWKGESIVDNVFYKRMRKGIIGYGKIPFYQYLHEYVEALYNYALKEKPEIIHAASNFMNGLATNIVAKALGIYSVYEVRGLWEITRISRQPYWKNTEYYNMMVRLEAQAANEADAVICITEALKDEMVRRGVDEQKIHVVPNGVNTNRFVPNERNKKLEKKLNLKGKKVLGYIGSVVQYEGLDYLLEALAILKERGIKDLALLIVGDGDKLEDIKSLSSKLELDEMTTFTGRVPHEKVTDYYSLVDIAPFPRKSLPVTEMVSPLKPFEAMALNKTILASDVAALKEIIVEGVNGFLFRKDDVNDLADKLELLIKKEDFGKIFNPRKWASENRDWDYTANKLEDLYLRLVDVSLEKTSLSSDFLKIFDRYKEKYQNTNPNFLRSDDYARWSYVASRLKTRKSLLDVGIGIGQFINTLAATKRFSKLYGVDIGPHSSFLRFYDNYTIDYVSISELPYSDNEFDIVTCMETLEHLDDGTFEKGLANLRRVCREQLIITVPFCEEPLSKSHLRKFEISDLKELFPEAEITLMKKSQKKSDKRDIYWCLIEENLS